MYVLNVHLRKWETITNARVMQHREAFATARICLPLLVCRLHISYISACSMFVEVEQKRRINNQCLTNKQTCTARGLFLPLQRFWHAIPFLRQFVAQKEWHRKTPFWPRTLYSSSHLKKLMPMPVSSLLYKLGPDSAKKWGLGVFCLQPFSAPAIGTACVRSTHGHNHSCCAFGKIA